MSVPIEIPDAFELEELMQMQDKYVVPFSGYPRLDNLVHPRRLLGQYLTFLVDDGDSHHSVLVKKVNNSIGIQCDCNSFVIDDKCIHTARVIHSMIKSLQRKERKLKDEALDVIQQELLKRSEHLLDAVPPNTSLTTDSIGQITEKEAADGPFLIQNVRTLTTNKLFQIYPKLNVNLKVGKSFKKLKEYKDGIDMMREYRHQQNQVQIRVNENADMLITCSCGEVVPSQLCHHAVETLYHLMRNHGRDFFVKYINIDNEKNRLLEEYGITVDDPEAKEFTFDNDYGNRLILSKVPAQFVSTRHLGRLKSLIKEDATKIRKSKYKDDHYNIGVYFHLTDDIFTNAPVKLEAYKSEAGAKGNLKLTKVLIGKEENLHLLHVLDSDKLEVLMDFSFLRFGEKISMNYHSGSFSYFSSNVSESSRNQYLRYFYDKIEEHWSFLAAWDGLKVMVGNNHFAASNLEDVKLAEDYVYADLKVDKTDKFIIIESVFRDIDNNIVINSGESKQIYGGKLILSNGILYLNKNNHFIELMNEMPSGKLIFSVKYEDIVVKELLHPLVSHYGIHLPASLSYTTREYAMSPVVYLREAKNMLIIEPKFGYGHLELDMRDDAQHYIQEEGIKYLLLRDQYEEKDFIEFIKSRHSHFSNQRFQPFFTLPFDEVMKKNWFIDFARNVMSKDIRLEGIDNLKQFKYNTATPKWDMNISSGIDWFDIHVKVSWGDMEVSLRDIRKAILSGQNFIVLGDGSFGILPEEWITRYSNLFKFSIEDKEGLRINKRQFNIVEMLFNEIDNQEVIDEINEKKQKLLHLKDIKPEPIPDTIRAELRPYQHTGYQWMQILDEISWGGCLADDMGLGKTLQAITFLAYVKQKYNHPTSLIVCPMSLIFNWENELKKFAPDLKFHIFYGSDRVIDDTYYEENDIIISTYGVIRNEIERLMKYEWEYVILDESQAIKNPDAISTKAVQLLKARNRFILSGTPLQNNTYDIYAQFNFLNPGMLGAREFFRTEFANPIDKNGDKDTGLYLRNLIKPFILRRTKGEVEMDLPDKTETILWCQMDKQQKSVYDEYRDFYRNSVLQKIDKEGMSKSGIYILEGLLRLRQICDDPRLIKDSEIKPTKGIKIKELVREIEENMGDHKMLVFSQFTEMLALIRKELDGMGIQYCYLDGSTPAADRKKQVEFFQNNKEIKVFLISLKAGGVGLNLTAADYVYIVDPWWNPAVEQQAIDRAHRIGQTHKIFAYRMICKDSVEEKIVKLQERKLALTREIIQEDSAFFKSLTREDIVYLFS